MTATPTTPAGTAAKRPPRRLTTPQTSVLYDAPGPRAKRITLVASVVIGIAIIAGAWLFVIEPLRDKGQFSAELWGPLIDPSNASFTLLWQRLGQGAQATLAAAVLSILSSLIFGTLLAVVRIQLKELAQRRYVGLPAPAALVLRALTWVLNVVTRVCVEIFRGLPVVITIFFVGRGLPGFGLDFSNPLWYLVIGLTIYNMVVIAEILRSGMEGLPIGQREAAASIGLTPTQTTRLVLLPQAFRIMLPALISQLVVVLKDTSLAFIISYEELLNVAKQATQLLHNPIQLYFVVGLFFILVNYSLSKLAGYVQRRLSRRGSSISASEDAATTEAVAVPGSVT
ncbi:amino acid ABC transporter permease [Planosporangium thailandense]|uniref:Amino acid ABC transporter permease n=1 Tax=Planosporangium thailandense TaxID=765197 RepID=A0ABX0XSP0_9ACTN|nr:amino acid ABC transporter permease [Planosporangium thailandense]NJC68300.1 amino acid ABC transporter permease [Planosporangium thailandense]